ncbi:Flp pilus assembly protein CpaB [Bradyrhizobium sp. JYMT SZCCT0180]|uniref:Flp pilus assembly protein CpaB n=1 Tax=Bradyrhizobium sp. JYMT SZCCT0180 TaxID=2807666 RepID=UPI001BAA40E1|nr:Flp pilus assembly protein CpaB [Bradyrhizobium sp. JYMT SZCCT0180]MBR1215125.1 Flp pilus assembly protein CpaB [Bradyrhizobium sp. JYMT SZCCT0180]
MNTARIVVLAIAISAGGVAAYLASGIDKEAPAPVAAVPQLPTVDVLVAKDDIGLGQTVAAENLQWQTWTESSSSGSFIRKKDRPEAITQIVGSIARMPFIAGEPIREQKLVKANGSGFMAAILPTGMRAVSTEISAETGAGGFILPNDRVDVILSKREKQQSIDGAGQPPDIISSQTVLTNVRVLAIDQAPKEKEGQNAVLGKTATLEMTPDEVEVLGKARLSGTLSLALRSIADSKTTAVASTGNSKLVTVYRGSTSADVLSCTPLCARR